MVVYRRKGYSSPMTRDGEISDHDYEALAAFRHALRRFAAFSETEAKAAGLTPRQHQALLAIKGRPKPPGIPAGPAPSGLEPHRLGPTELGPHGLGVGEIAEHLLIRHNTAVELVDRLAEAGLVRRQPDPADGRRIVVTLTDRAESLLRRLSAAHVRELRAIRPSLLSLLQTF
jgi:DNA-binding MarR family transcriptional regulator